jgi:exopolyphosphatase/guanosine-5'-triphosphate,3'-diphosphate pyrophosphatase
MNVAAIDVGSNAVRLIIARVSSPAKLQTLRAERCALRLGSDAFAHHAFAKPTLRRTVKVFSRFRSLLERYQVTTYRAVATSAVREARNRQVLVDRIYRKTGIWLEVIDGEEESRLERLAVLSVLDSRLSPRAILDLGGGSLEVSFLRDGRLERAAQLAVGTVRLMERFKLDGAIRRRDEEKVRSFVLEQLEKHLPVDLDGELAVACGGNAEALARLFPGRRLGGHETLDVLVLRRQIDEILRLDVRGRMSVFQVRRDRAEVMGIAAIVFDMLGRWLDVRSLLVPGVGIREGLVKDLATARHVAGRGRSSRSQPAGSRRAAVTARAGLSYAQEVHLLAVSLLDRLRHAPVAADLGKGSVKAAAPGDRGPGRPGRRLTLPR